MTWSLLKKTFPKTSLCQRLRDGHFITSTEDLNRLVADYNSTLSNLLNHHAPLKSKTVGKRPSVPWYTAEIGAAKRLRRKAERKWRRTGLHEDFIAFKSQRTDTVPEDFEIGPQKFLSSFKPLTEAAICRLIQSSAKKSCALVQ